MDWAQILITIAGTAIGSTALFSFLQFLIQRKDKKKENNIEDRIKQEKETINEHFKELEQKLQDGLDAREKTGSERFNKHEQNIKEMMTTHKEDFNKLLATFESLKETDERIRSTIDMIAQNQKNVCDALNGLAHDKIVYMTDRITERGFITLKERATLDSIYFPYKTMGGNSHAKAGYEHVIELDIVSDEVAKHMDDEIKRKRREKAIIEFDD